MLTKRVLLASCLLMLIVFSCATVSSLYDPMAPVRAALYDFKSYSAASSVTGTCTKADIDAVIQSYSDLLQKLSVNVVIAAKNESVQFQSMVQIASFFSSAINRLSPCQGLLEAFVTGTESVDVTIPFTKKCVAEAGTPEFNKDPCCSQEGSDRKCCTPRPVTIQANRISSWANSTIYATCRHPETVKSVISNFYRRYKSNMHQCAASTFKKQVMFAESVQKVSECYKKVFQEPISCETDSDCFLGATCDANTKKCSGASLEDGTPLVECIKSSVTEEAFYNLKYILGAEGKTTPEVTTKFMDFITTEMCVDGFVPIFPKPDLADQTTCLAQTKCNDNTDTCSGNNPFCGAIKAPNGIYLFDTTVLLPDQASCTAHGICVGATGDNIYKLTKTECESGFFCTNPDCGADCTKEKCEALGRCIGNPLDRDICLLPFSYDASGRVCGNFAVKTASGCVSTVILSEGVCTLANGKWYQKPDTKAKCEAFQACANNGAINFRNQTVCQECGGTPITVFRWAPARYLNRRFVPATNWVSRAEKSVNLWKRVLDIGKLIPAFTKFTYALQYPIYKSYISCVMNPPLTTLRMLACDCDASVPAGTDCFSEEALKSTAASFRLLGSVDIDQEYSTPEVSVSISASAKHKVTVNIDVTKTEVIVDVDISKARRIAATDGIPVLQGSATVGQIVGNGFSMQGSTTFSATLCIQRDPTMTVSNSDYSNPAFAIKDSKGNYVVTNIPINSEKTGDGSSQICGIVTDTRTYYPSMVNDAAAPPVVSHAVALKPSLISQIVFALCALLVLIY